MRFVALRTIIFCILSTTLSLALYSEIPKIKFIRIEKSEGVLSLAEVEVYVANKNIASSGKAEQSSLGPAGAEKAIDGKTDGIFFNKSVTHTDAKDPTPWWQLTFATPVAVDSLTIWNRTDCCGDRLDGARLIYLDENKKVIAETILKKIDKSMSFQFSGKELMILKPPAPIVLAKPNTIFDDGFKSRYKLHYDQQAPLDLKGWENLSLPLGNGHFGVSFFGGVDEEIYQFTEKSLFVQDDTMTNEKAYDLIGLSSLMELHLFMNPGDKGLVERYGRGLELDRALGRVSYQKNGVEFHRELFTSYPDRVFVTRLTSSSQEKISFQLKAIHPFLGMSRTGTAEVAHQTLILKGLTKPYQLAYEVQVRVETTKGSCSLKATESEGEISVVGADEALIYVTLGTSYKLSPTVFLESDRSKKLDGLSVPHEKITSDLASAVNLGWDSLKHRHIADYQNLFQQADIRLGGEAALYLTDKLLESQDKTPGQARYLEELYFQYGRYLLISSSRKGTLLANLQGTWNMNRKAPWTGGYWANINIQMNYWPAFVTGLSDTFEPYWNFFEATFKAQQGIAVNTQKNWKSSLIVEDGWTAGTGNSPFTVGGPGTTSGAGTGPFVLLPLWDWYLFTKDKTILEKIWPFLVASSRFLNGILKPQEDGNFLCDPSWSPENKKGSEPHVNLPGTAYDQQLIYENHRMTLEAAKILGKTDPILEKVRAQMDHLSPVLIGTSGQLKEFRQEQAYGEYGDPHHRHISHLIGLYPGTIITEKPEWLQAAKVSLDKRGDKSTGWAMAHRLNAWARLRDGERTHLLLQTLLNKGTMANLWDTHPPFQIDGNFGGTSGIAEMLLQSHDGKISIIPAIPKAWASGSFTGLRARDGFIVSAEWSAGTLTKATITSQLGGVCRVALAKGYSISGKDGKSVAVKNINAESVEFQTEKNGVYEVVGR